jgi:hypothetical protein
VQQPGRALDVREEERDGALREVAHGHMIARPRRAYDPVVRRSRGPWLIAGALGLAAGGSAAAPAPDESLFVLDRRAGPYRYLDSFRKRTSTGPAG